MGKMNTGYSSFSSGPEHTQAIPTLDHTPTIPTQYGIPNMSMDSFGVDSNADMSMAEDGKNGPNENGEWPSGRKQIPYHNPNKAAQGPHSREAHDPYMQGPDPVKAFKFIHETAEKQAKEDPGLFRPAHATKSNKRTDVHKYTRSSDLPKDNPYYKPASDEVPSDSDMSMAEDETIVHPRGTGKPAIYAGTSGGKHPDHEANFENHLSAIGKAAEEQRPMSVREGVLTKAKTHRVENLPKE